MNLANTPQCLTIGKWSWFFVHSMRYANARLVHARNSLFGNISAILRPHPICEVTTLGVTSKIPCRSYEGIGLYNTILLKPNNTNVLKKYGMQVVHDATYKNASTGKLGFLPFLYTITHESKIMTVAYKWVGSRSQKSPYSSYHPVPQIWNATWAVYDRIVQQKWNAFVGERFKRLEGIGMADNTHRHLLRRPRRCIGSQQADM